MNQMLLHNCPIFSKTQSAMNKVIKKNNDELDVFQQIAGTMYFFIKDMEQDYESHPEYREYIKEANKMKKRIYGFKYRH